MSQDPSAALTHGTPPVTAVVLVNLGTPDAPTAPALRRYLREFLSDPRVVEIPRLFWWPLLNGIILPVRGGKSAAKYATIWTPRGSPLLTASADLADACESELRRRGHHLVVRLAMRYGNPSIASVMDELLRENVTRVLLVPLYPQYCAATTASTYDAFWQWAAGVRRLPEVRAVNQYHDEPGYVDALAHRIEAHWERNGRPDKLLMSFHGMPARTRKLGDPYFCACHKTARLLAERLGLAADAWQVTFQSRFGKQEWLQPYTEPTLRELARRGTGRVDVICPGFSVDCLETLEEIAVEGKQAFLSSGGKEFHYIDCLNAGSDWVPEFSTVLEQHMQGWDTRSAPDFDALRASRDRARDLGAVNLTAG